MTHGFAGFFDLAGQTPDCAADARSMVTGGAAVWADPAAGLAFAAERQAESPDGRWVLALDGALFNAADLCRRLAPTGQPAGSHAEILAEAVARWGMERALQAADGAFAAVLWDRVERSLHLVRDRFGERRLVWGQFGNTVLFATTLAALRRHPAFVGDIDRDALAAMLQLGFVPSPLSIHRHVRKLAPGTVLSIQGKGVVTRPLWLAADRMRTLAGSFTGGPAAAAERLNLLLRGSVASRFDADRLACVMLSGGPGSSLVAAVARELGGHIDTLTLAESGTDAAAVADRLGTGHTDVTISDAEALALVRDLPRWWDEPLADPGQMAAMVLARAAADRSAVVLTGEGANSLFGGNPLHAAVAADWNKIRETAPWLRRAATWATPFRPELADLAAPTPAALLGRKRLLWRGLPSPVDGARAPLFTAPDLGDPVLEAMAADILTTLPDRACALSGGAATGAGVEIRRPFLDAKLAEFAWSLPTAMKTAGGPAQSCLREVLWRYVPGVAEDPPPLSAALPIGRWLDGPLAEWAGDLLAEDRLRRQGLVNPRAVVQSRRHNRVPELWAMLMAQAWIDSLTA